MPKPTTKVSLLEAAQNNFVRLNDYIEKLPPGDLSKEFPEKFLNRNIRDVVAHIHHWHILFLGWYEVGMKGDKPAMPSQGYTWRTMNDLNKKVLEQYSSINLKKARTLLNISYAQVYAIIEKHSEKELFTKKKYAWTGSTSLGAYLISNTCSYYDWGIKIIKKGVK